MTAPPQAPTTVDLLVVLTRVETKLDAAEIGRADHEQRLRTIEQTAARTADLATLGVRTSRLERWMWLAIGASGAVGAASGWAASVVTAH